MGEPLRDLKPRQPWARLPARQRDRAQPVCAPGGAGGAPASDMRVCSAGSGAAGGGAAGGGARAASS